MRISRGLKEAIRMERFEDIYDSLQKDRMSCEEAAKILGCSIRHFLRLRGRKAGLVAVSKRGGPHRLRRPRRPMSGMMIHQDASKHVWFGTEACDLVVSMDDATSEITSAFFCEEEGTNSSFRGIHETISQYGLFCSFYTDRGSHYFYTPEVGGKVDKSRPTQVGRALSQLSKVSKADACPHA